MRVESGLPAELEELVHTVIGASIEAHRQLGPGFLESLYEQALCIELEERGLRFERQKEFFSLTRGTT